ncbi:MAG TPA: response regulator [Bacteriovoracaceae bacterium]|nr:response regulator [Bacteriovoracaceae bacterium]
MNKLPDDIRLKRFLVVDDYESMRIMVADHLKQMGVENIQFCKSGNEALALINNLAGTPTQIEVLLTDLMMDDGSGLDLVKGLRSQPKFKSLPILMVTSKAEVAFVIACVQAGVNTYIVKPWKIEDLNKKIIDTVNKAK